MELPELDPVIHQPTRLRIVTLLHRNRDAALAWTREALELTYGNLDSHVSTLEEAGFVERRRALTPGGFQVRLRLTEQGLAAYEAYLDSLRAYLEGAEAAQEPTGAPASQAPR